MSQKRLGIDPGNAFCMVALQREERKDPLILFPEKYQFMKTGMPSSVYPVPPAGERLEAMSDGIPALYRHAREPDRLVHAVKTRLHETAVRVPGIESPVLVEKMFAAIIRDAVMLANEVCRERGEPGIYHLVFTYPAIFADQIDLLNRMKHGIESETVNGHNLVVDGCLPEPAAAAIDYLYYMENLISSDKRITEEYTALVYDLGYGTFDCAVVSARRKGEPYQMHLSDGLADVGCLNFDQVLYEEIIRILKKKYSYEPANGDECAVLMGHVVELKHDLSNETDGTVEIQLRNGEYAEISVSRKKFEELSKHLIVKTLEIVDRVLTQAEEMGIRIDACVLTGGGSKMPMVSEALEMYFNGTLPVALYRPSEAVAFGTARYAAGIQRLNAILPKETNSKNQEDFRQKPNTILEQNTECSYGLWLPSVANMAGEIRCLIRPAMTLPYTSEPICVAAASDKMVVRLFRSKQKNVTKLVMPVSEAVEIFRFPFTVEKQMPYKIKIRIREDRNMDVIIISESGETQTKTTSDPIEVILR